MSGGAEIVEVTEDGMVQELKNVATWLEAMPDHAQLYINGTVIVQNPHRAAGILRLALPVESRA